MPTVKGKGTCVECDRGPLTLPGRGLCFKCYGNPEIRAKHPRLKWGAKKAKARPAARRLTVERVADLGHHDEKPAEAEMTPGQALDALLGLMVETEREAEKLIGQMVKTLLSTLGQTNRELRLTLLKTRNELLQSRKLLADVKLEEE